VTILGGYAPVARREELIKEEDDPYNDENDNPILPTRTAYRALYAENEPKTELLEESSAHRASRTALPDGWTGEEATDAIRIYKNLENKDLTLKALGRSRTSDNRRNLTTILEQAGVIED